MNHRIQFSNNKNVCFNSYPYEDKLSGFPYFHLIYTGLLYAAFMISTTIGAVDGLCVTFSLYFAAMFKTLQYEVQQIFEAYESLNGEQTYKFHSFFNYFIFRIFTHVIRR